MEGRKRLPSNLASVSHLLHIVEELKEHDPCEHGQAVEVCAQALVLAHNVAAGLDEATYGLGMYSEVHWWFFLAITPPD
jgi:hypothetical protein